MSVTELAGRLPDNQIPNATDEKYDHEERPNTVHVRHGNSPRYRGT